MAYHQRLLPAYTQLKVRWDVPKPLRSGDHAHDRDVRQPGQGGDADREVRDLRAELLKAEAAHNAKTKGLPQGQDDDTQPSTISWKRQLENGSADEEQEDLETKRRRVLEETRDIDADSDGSAEESSTDER